jgi:hypothetical protein
MYCVHGMATGMEGTHPWTQKKMWTEQRNLYLKTEQSLSVKLLTSWEFHLD